MKYTLSQIIKDVRDTNRQIDKFPTIEEPTNNDGENYQTVVVTIEKKQPFTVPYPWRTLLIEWLDGNRLRILLMNTY